jgi:hypothetical protein
MARKAGQIITRGASTRLVRVYLGRDSQTGTCKYLNRTTRIPYRPHSIATVLVKPNSVLAGHPGGGGWKCWKAPAEAALTIEPPCPCDVFCLTSS